MTLKKRSYKVIGIDIGSTMIKMVEVIVSETPKLTKWASIDIPPGNMETSKAQNRKMAMALKMCLKLLKPSTRNASICLSDTDVIIKDMIIPAMGKNEMLENIRFELSDYFSADLREHQISYKLYGDNDSIDKNNLAVLVAAAPIVLLKKYKDMVGKSGLKLKYIDVSANCIAKLLDKMRNNDETNTSSQMKQIQCIADLGTNTIEISVYEGRNFEINRRITASNENYDDLVVYELSQVFEYYQRKYNDKRITKIFLIGGKSYTDGLVEVISDQLSVPVEVVRPDMFTLFSVDEEEKDEKIQRAKKEEFPIALYFKALGSALRED